MFQCRRASGIASVSALLLLVSGAAQAQEEAPPDDSGMEEAAPDDSGMDEAAPDDSAMDEPAGTESTDTGSETEYTMGLPQSDPTKERLRMTLPEGRLLVQASIEMNLSTDLAFKPVSLSPDVWYGLTDDISLGLTHSGNGTAGFYGGVSDSLCLVGDSNGCGGVYRNVSLLGRYSLIDTGLGLAAQGGLVVSDIDPFTFGIQLGAVGRWESRPIAVVFHPNVYIGLNRREGDAMLNIAGNSGTLALPVAVMYDVMPALAVGLQTGLTMGFDDVATQWVVPVSLGGRYEVMPGAWAELVFSLPIVVTGADPAPGAFDTRVLTLGGGTVF
jgi:hypothetical protein